jgi:hypothetical protein
VNSLQPQRQLIGLGHTSGVGRSDIAAALAEHFEFTHLSFSHPIKQMLMSLDPLVELDGRSVRLSRLVTSLGWDDAQDIPEVRSLLRRLGTEASLPVFGPDCWARLGMRRAAGRRRVVFSDLRSQPEFSSIQAAGGLTVRVLRHLDQLGQTSGEHQTETALADADWDLTFINDGGVGGIYWIAERLTEMAARPEMWRGSELVLAASKRPSVI